MTKYRNPLIDIIIISQKRFLVNKNSWFCCINIVQKNRKNTLFSNHIKPPFCPCRRTTTIGWCFKNNTSQNIGAHHSNTRSVYGCFGMKNRQNHMDLLRISNDNCNFFVVICEISLIGKFFLICRFNITPQTKKRTFARLFIRIFPYISKITSASYLPRLFYLITTISFSSERAKYHCL